MFEMTANTRHPVFAALLMCVGACAHYPGPEFDAATIASQSYADCSNSEFVCGKSDSFTYVVPRACRSFSVGDRWHFMDTGFEVLDEADYEGLPSHISSHTAYMILKSDSSVMFRLIVSTNNETGAYRGVLDRVFTGPYDATGMMDQAVFGAGRAPPTCSGTSGEGELS